jgi:hypothetical protein
MRTHIFTGLAVLFMILGIGYDQSTAQPTQEDAEQYFGLYERLRVAMGGVPQPVPMLQIPSRKLIIWPTTNGNVRLVMDYGPYQTCKFGGSSSNMLDTIRQDLLALSGPTPISELSGAQFISSNLTSLIMNISVPLPIEECTLDIHNISTGLMGAIGNSDNPNSISEIRLLLPSSTITVKLGKRSWLFDQQNRTKLLQTVRTQKIKRLVSFGDVGLLGTNQKNEIIFWRWQDGKRINLLSWQEAQGIVNSERMDLFSHSRVVDMADEEAYLSFLGNLSHGKQAWINLIRQAPHIVFRKWQ